MTDAPTLSPTQVADDKLHVHQERCSMLALIDRGGDNSHPANWAPFVVVWR
jgi:hypothetical protein